MIVILEGVDGVGKTTIAKQLQQKYKFKYIHESYTDDIKEKETRVLFMMYRLLNNKNYIYDRATLIDDFVYGFLNKNKNSLEKFKNLIIDILKKCKIIHLQLDENIRKKRFENRGDQYIKNDQIAIIKKNYKKFYKNLSNVKYVTLEEDQQKNIDKIMEVIIND